MASEFYNMVDYHFKVEERVTKEKLNAFCDVRNDFLCLPNILREFAQQDQTYGTQHDVDNLNIFKSMLDACKDVNTVATFQTMILEWNTGALFGLTQFKADFVDNVKLAPLVNDVIIVKKAIGIVTTIHKLKIAREMMYNFYVCCTIYQRLKFIYLFLRLIIRCTAATLEFILKDLRCI